jgi:hypothetical protein
VSVNPSRREDDGMKRGWIKSNVVVVCGDKCMKFCYIVALVYIVVGTQNHQDHHYYQLFIILPVLGKSLNNDSLTPGARIVLSAPPHLAIYPGYSSRCDSQKKLFPSFFTFFAFSILAA